jgi:hypothetical protein
LHRSSLPGAIDIQPLQGKPQAPCRPIVSSLRRLSFSTFLFSIND